MNSILNRIAIGTVVLAFAMPAMAATRSQKRDGSSNGTPVKKVDRKRDGTGSGTPAAKSAQRKQTGGGTGDRKRDGSCK